MRTAIGSRRRFDARHVGAIVGLFILAPMACTSQAPERPNVLVYVVDTLRADALGHYGGPADGSPEIDRFAADAMSFEHAWADSSWTRASMASLLTGAIPSRHRAEDRGEPLDGRLPTLPEILRNEGYSTAMITANPNAGSFFGFARGFDEMIELYERRGAGDVTNDELVVPASFVTKQAIRWIRAASEPFFLVALSVDTHSPYRPPDGHSPDGRPQDTARSSTVPERAEIIRSWYQAEVIRTDAAFGALLDFLRETKQLDDTIVVFTSDHGEEFFEHGSLYHGKTLFEEVLRIPLLLRYPASNRVRAGERIAGPAQLSDLAPTLLDLLRIEPSPTMDGSSLLQTRARAAESEPMTASLRLDDRQLESARADRWKLLRAPRIQREWLFDLDRDPTEKKPITGDYADEALAARARLAEALARRHQAPRTRLPESPTALPADVRRSLEALGYLDPEAP